MLDRTEGSDSLRESELRYRTLLENLPGMAYRCRNTIDWPMEFVSAGCRDLTGYSTDELTRNTPDYGSLIHPDDRQSVWTSVQAALQKGSPYVLEYRIRHRNGSERWVWERGRAVKGAGGAVALEGFIYDISETKRTASELTIRNVLLSTQQEALDDGILAVDADERIISCNRRFKELFTVPETLVEKREDAPLLTWVTNQMEDPTRFLAKVRHLYAHRHEKSRDELSLRDGRAIDRYSAPMLDPTGRYLGRIWFFHDITERKNAEAELNAAREYLANIIESLPDPTFVIDQDSKVTAWNSALSEMTGVSREELLGQGGYAYAVPFYGERRPILIDYAFSSQHNIREPYTDVKETGTSISAEVYATRIHGGKGGHLWCKASPLRDPSGRTIGAIESVRDISAAKEAEQRLREVTRMLRSVVQASPLAIAAIDREKNVRMWNPAAERIFGYTEREVLGQHYPLLTEAGRAQADAHLEALWHGAEYQIYEALRRSKDGRELHCQISTALLRDELDDQPLGVLIMIADISAQKDAERGLRESEQKYRLLVESFPHIVGIIQDQRIVYMNEAGARMLGHAGPEELIGAEETARVDEGDRERLRQFAAKRIKDPSSVPGNYVTRFRRKDGSILPAEVFASPIMYNGRKAIQAIAFDITERQRAQEERERLNRLALTGQLAAGVAHEIRNPLHAAMQFLELMRPRLPDAKSQGWAEMMEESLRRIERLSSRLLRLGRGAEGTRTLCDLGQIVNDAMELIGPRSRKEGIALSVVAPPDLPPIPGYSDRLIEALLNLLINALDACAKGDRIDIRIAPEGETITVSVADTGPGIPSELIDRIFEPFFTTKPIGKGSGLGLPLVRKIAEEHDGSLNVVSEAGRGAEFVLRFPIKPSE